MKNIVEAFSELHIRKQSSLLMFFQLPVFNVVFLWITLLIISRCFGEYTLSTRQKFLD